MNTQPYIETLYDGKRKTWTNITRNVTSNANQYNKPFKNKPDAIKLGCQAANINNYPHQIRAKNLDTHETCPNH